MSTVPKIFSAELDGINAELVEVEADINVGLHSFNIVGLADKAVSEAKERVNSALKNSGIKPPTKENRRITINLAPADIKKAGSRFDLPIAIAYLLSSEQIKPFDVKNKIFVGELSLDGALRQINGSLNIALLAKRKGLKEIYLPETNAVEAGMIDGLKIFPVCNLNALIMHLEGKRLISPSAPTKILGGVSPTLIKMDEVKGQTAAKRALMVAAAGGHNVLLSGPPGTGKTMMAQALTSILPPATPEELIEINQVWSAAGLNMENGFINSRPFRAPHHSSSLISIVGGGTNPRPGEISLAHRGILFLDETPEFHRDVLEALRQPLERGEVNIARARKTLTFPSRFMLLAAMNPCPCGYFGDKEKECHCTANEILRYQKKLSGPLLDRIDIQLEIPRIPIEELRKKDGGKKEGHRKNEIENKIIEARNKQKERFANSKIFTNSEMSSKLADEIIKIEDNAEDFLKMTLEKNFVSARGYYRILKVAQTIADLENSPILKTEHLAEAFQYRLKTNE